MMVDTPTTLARSINESGVVGLLLPQYFAPNPDQPRQTWEEEDVKDLARSVASFRERGLGSLGSGFIHPLKVRLPAGATNVAGELRVGAFERGELHLIIISGETKWRAARLIATEGVLVPRSGRSDDPLANDTDAVQPAERIIIPDITIPFMLEDVNADEALELSYAENGFRKDLNPLDEGLFFRRYRERTKASLSQMTAKFSKDRRHITRRLATTKMGEDCQALLRVRSDALFSALVIDDIKNTDLRKELIASAASGTPFRDIEDRVKAYKESQAITKAKSNSTKAASVAPDRETSSRSAAFTSGNPSSSSRGQRVTSSNQQDATREFDRHLHELDVWKKHLPANTKTRYARQLRAMAASLEQDADA